MMEDLVPAGSSPHQWDDPLESVHRQISFMLFMSSLLFAMIVGNLVKTNLTIQINPAVSVIRTSMNDFFSHLY